jgi:type I restriction enzyme S subunit
MRTAWAIRPLGEICDIRIGRTPTRSESRFWGGDRPWLSIKDMNQGRELWETAEGITDAAVEEQNCRLVEPGTVLLSFKLSIGKVGVAQRPLYTNEAIAQLPLATKEVDRDYLYWALRTVPLTGDADRAAMGATLNKAKLKRIPVPVPPLEEQRRIAAVLDAADALRAKRREALAKLDTLTQAIFIDMFGDPVANPHGWRRSFLSEVLDRIDSGKSPTCHDRPAAPGEWGVLKAGAVSFGTYRPNENKSLPASISPDPRHEVKPGDILFSRKNTHDLVATTAYVPTTPPQLLMSDLIFRLVISPAAEVDPRFLQAQLAIPRKRKEVQGLAAGSSGSMPNISKAKVRNVEIVKPPYGLQADFAARVREVGRAIERAEQSAKSLDELFASLQQRALKGEM